jgi:hypothetical protein
VSSFADTCVPHTLTACASGYLFVGSRLGDSQLLQYWLEGQGGGASDVIGEQLQLEAKRVKTESEVASAAVAMEAEDLELYGQYLTPAPAKDEVGEVFFVALKIFVSRFL